MELSRTSVVRTERRPGLGRCKHFFWLGVVFDTVGATVLFTGVFADLLFSDLLLYLGSIIIFLSLLWWIFWYTGNIELTTEETLKGPLRVPTARPLEALSQTVSHRFFTIGNVPTTLLRMRQQRRRRRFLQKTASLSMTVSGQVEKQMEKEDQDRNGVKSVQESGDAQEICREGLSPKPEAVKSSEGIPTPCPGDCPLGPEAGLPMFIKRQSTHLVQPEFTSSSLDQPLHPAVLVSKSQPLVSLASGSQSPPITCVSTAVQDLQTLHHTQKTSRSSSLVQEISLRQSSSAQEFYKKPIAQAFETPADQKRSPEVPESHAPAAQAQQSVSPESAPLPRSGEERSSFLV
ncbi:uncharacterized protein [Manis javanica]|uniref:uncharacterized protein isoform X2 n=1 Tax=Manis javanica TaxID=9974 RepID=UPI000813445B|nr:uncharacterized protein LOC108398595 isoform X2 [Manis javanica]KAI5940015.1 Transmembrane protein 238 [Manis javanica]